MLWQINTTDSTTNLTHRSCILLVVCLWESYIISQTLISLLGNGETVAPPKFRVIEKIDQASPGPSLIFYFSSFIPWFIEFCNLSRSMVIWVTVLLACWYNWEEHLIASSICVLSTFKLASLLLSCRTYWSNQHLSLPWHFHTKFSKALASLVRWSQFQDNRLQFNQTMRSANFC